MFNYVGFLKIFYCCCYCLFVVVVFFKKTVSADMLFIDTYIRNCDLILKSYFNYV